jgi:ribosomal protein S18 acetylase RimI-like enzyme
MENIVIVPYEARYWEALMEIHDAARMTELEFAGLKDAFIPLSIAAEREGLFDYSVDVALVDGVPVGFCAYTDEELAWLYVSPAYARRGIGTRLIRGAMEKESGIHEIEVLYGNEPARRLYEKMGFRVKEIVSGKMPGNESFDVRVYSMER